MQITITIQDHPHRVTGEPCFTVTRRYRTGIVETTTGPLPVAAAEKLVDAARKLANDIAASASPAVGSAPSKH